jgi:hypothetical protein
MHISISYLFTDSYFKWLCIFNLIHKNDFQKIWYTLTVNNSKTYHRTPQLSIHQSNVLYIYFKAIYFFLIYLLFHHFFFQKLWVPFRSKFRISVLDPTQFYRWFLMDEFHPFSPGVLRDTYAIHITQNTKNTYWIHKYKSYNIIFTTELLIYLFFTFMH